MTDTEPTFERPPLRIDLGAKEIKMSYGLEMDLRRMLPNAESALRLVMSDPVTQDYLVRRCLTPVSKVITSPEDLVQSVDVELTSDDVERLLMWVTEHVLYFFVKRAQSIGQIGARYQQILPGIAPSTPSENGSETSPSMTPSAGPSE